MEGVLIREEDGGEALQGLHDGALEGVGIDDVARHGLVPFFGRLDSKPGRNAAEA